MQTERMTRLQEAFDALLRGVPKKEAWEMLMDALVDEGFENLTGPVLNSFLMPDDPQKKLFVYRLEAEMYPDAYEAHYILGSAYRDNKRYVEALQSFDSAITIAMSRTDARFTVHVKNDIVFCRILKAETLLEMGQPGEAFVELLLAKKMLLSTDKPLERLSKQIDDGFKSCVF